MEGRKMPRPDRAPYQSSQKVRNAVYEIRSVKDHRKLVKEAVKPNANPTIFNRTNLPRRNPDV
jgi:hypothetical protein